MLNTVLSGETNTVRNVIDRMALTRAELAFLIAPETGGVLTFVGLREQAQRLCARFRKMGLEHGDKIALLMDNGLFTAQLFLGAMYGGFVSVPLNVRAGVSQLSYMLDHCDAKIVFVGSQYATLIKEVMKGVRRQIEIVSVDNNSLCQNNQGPYVIDGSLSIEADDAALLMYSSGTTGQPKGAIHTHRSVLAHGKNSILSHELTAADRSLLVLPLYHINAECVTLIPTLMSGGSLVIPRGFVLSEFWNWLDDYRCTWSALVPTIISQLLDWKDPKANSRAAAFQRIRFLRTSSAPLSPSLHREFLDKFSLPLIQAMGSSEAGNVFSNPVTPGRNKIGSPGLPWGFETKVVDREGEELRAGEAGEVLIRGEGMMHGYYKDPAGTAVALDAQGWLHTGDFAYRDEDGYFFIVGRSKELVIKGGMNIAPKQIDEVLETHPAVLEAAAVGVPDRYVGEDLIGFVVVRSEKVVDEKELLAFCESRLGHFKTPTRLHFVKDLPKGPSGKVQRLKLQDIAAKLSASELLASERIPTAPREEQGSGGVSVPSLVEIEQIISETWGDLLQQVLTDIHGNFFALGGHSLLAIRCLSQLREKLPVALSLSDFFENPTVAQQATVVRRRLALNAPNHAQAHRDQSAAIAAAQTIPPRNRELPCPLSPGQQRLWFLEQLNPGLPIYNESEAMRLLGELNIDAMEQAINAIIQRHEILRSTIETVDGQPMTVVHENWPLRLKTIDLSGMPPTQRESEVQRLLLAEPRRLYHLEVEPGIRATLLRLGPQEHVFILLMHHLVCDWSSEGVFWRELSALYRAFRRGEPADLPTLQIQHGDYATWQQKQVAGTDFAEELAFWEENLRGAPELLDLPTDRPRPRTISYRGGKKRFRIDRNLANALRDCARREKISLFTVFAAALNTLLYRYSGQEDILLGIPMADRDRQELQPLIGFLLQIGVLRTKLSGDMTFRDLLNAVQRAVLGVHGHRGVPYDQVVSKIHPERNLSYAPLVQVMLNWRDRDQLLSFIGMDGLRVEWLLSETKTAKFDLVVVLTDFGDDVWAELEYSADLFDDSRIDRMFGHYEKLLDAAAANSDGRLSELPLLTDEERQQLLVEWNRTEVAYPKDRCVHELFEEQVERTPDAVAVAFQDRQLTYRQLNDSANQLAHHLRWLGVGPDALVGICVERSLEMVVGLLAILKAGGAYVPMDPSYPGERLEFMLRDSDALVLLTHQSLRDQFEAGSPNARVLCLDADWGTIAASPTENPKCSAGPENLAYVIYTSGSTGEPKGVEIKHRGLLNLIFWHRRNYQVVRTDRATQLAGVGFDASVWELWPYLSTGASIHMPDEDTRLLPEKLRDWLVDNEISLTFVPTPLAEALVALTWPPKIALRALLTGGDRLTRHASSSLPFALINHYGPTEDTVVTTCGVVDIEGQGGKAPPIGKPIANTQTYVVDSRLQPVPIGVPGELLVSGDGLARGYLGRPDLTAEKFIANPFSRELGSRLYKTGDLVRYSPTGAIEFLGRNDDQVKIRGFRIELGEIESALIAHPAVLAASVLPREDVPGQKRLAAYVVTQPLSPSVSELRDYLKKRMPDYMLPSAFVILEQLPLTPNGKIDRAALPAPDSGDTLRVERGVEAATEVENKVAHIVASLLGIDHVDAQENFFDLGGHSLLGAQLIARVRAAFGINLPLRKVFEAATVSELSAEIEEILVAELEAMSDDEVRHMAGLTSRSPTEEFSL